MTVRLLPLPDVDAWDSCQWTYIQAQMAGRAGRVHRVDARTAVCQQVEAKVERATSKLPEVAEYDGIKLLDWDVEWTTTTEVLYTHGPAYSFISRDRKQCHPLVTCKDYLGDMAFATVNKWEVGAAGMFKYSVDTHPKICMSKMRIVFCNPRDKEFTGHIHNCADLIHKAERDFGLPKTVVRKVRNPTSKYKKTGMYLFMGSGAWMSSPVMLSLYTLLIRLGKAHKTELDWRETIRKVGNNLIDDPYYDRFICGTAITGVDRLKEIGWRECLGTDLSKNYPSGIREDITHSCFGIKAYGGGDGTCRQYCKHWFS